MTDTPIEIIKISSLQLLVRFLLNLSWVVELTRGIDIDPQYSLLDDPLPQGFLPIVRRPHTTMSARRTTRATSRQASETGASPAPSTTATPRRRRLANTALPAVGTRTSTAYGTNTVPQPSRAAGPQVSNQVVDILHGIIQNDDTASSKFWEPPPLECANIPHRCYYK
jgi:hypothetical protein